MIQRKQTLFLLAALILTIVCLCLPVGSVEPKGMGISPVIYNLGIKGTDSAFTFGNCPMFILLLITCPIAIAAIFLYHKGNFRPSLCVWNIVLNVVWYAYFGFCWYRSTGWYGHIPSHDDVGIPLDISDIICHGPQRYHPWWETCQGCW